MDGFLNLNKPQNFTSHDCVAKLRKILNTKKIGHGGTLDPSATGVLPIAIGKATRLLQFLPTEKAYQGKIRFGVVTTTDDLEGDVIKKTSAKHLTLEKITPFLKDFIGKIEQIPPAYSAIKQQGKKLYELARKGQVIDIPKREVIITKIDILHWQNGDFPELDLHIFCGGGTYIRSIARDLGEKLGTGATLSALNRTLSCDMIIENSLNFEEIIEGKKTANLSLINLDLPLKNLPSIYLNEEESKKWCQGQKITINNNLNQEFYRTYNYVSKFIGISELRINEDIILLKPKVVI
ncbi:MAG: tRNA pseudouridine(55) synthase TruB [Cyanobacteria bacterium]|nr:tRNA pseudouridine(55) synthase TruB [Cyanobacteria bacterium CG_2015-16_32_12]NCO78453.1 tRNA pseudouridine(55) synthase TruB [Cyanobacteria bacterium CG_2015-22_32_23]NCQ04069.1 tRNA pseudouridine(55) synthase TruB [Cyanobacteria bacterium CG_2015-09_32_10]NCQ42631.1 tRNA pseudouridine(55) synthase TruB [Cyanobacteria bacterium CG_2015-04_32_10]NCS83526.1 tRNA pseudouridine(55) synthase TruB [Cyanobacteria bacterium CG_2015-02_32_10]